MASTTRRLAAILAADVAGYSRLMGVDEEGTLADLKAIRRELSDPKIKEHRGRIVKTTGDGLLIEFASVVDAVRCAIEVQQAIAERNAQVPEPRRIKFRMGINLGDIIRDGRDIYGDGVNVAARLEALAEPGAVFVSNSVYEQVRDRLSLAFEDLGEQRVKNIARSVRVYAVRPDGITSAPTASAASTTPSLSPVTAPRLSIVVLPFANLSNDPEQQYFADGITEDLTTDLSRIAHSFVISRNTAFTYRNKPIDTKQIGRELGVRYVLEGSVRRSGNQVRVNAQLIDAETDAHLWAARFDRDIGDLFVLQNEITSRIAIALNLELLAAEVARSTDRPDARDYILRARAAYLRGPRRDNYAEIIENLERALALDPRSIEAQSRLAAELAGRVLDGLTATATTDLARAECLTVQALTVDPRSPLAHFARGQLLRAQRRPAEAIAEYETVIASDRNHVNALAATSWCMTYTGSLEPAIAVLLQVIALSPRDPEIGVWFGRIGLIHLLQSRFDEAVLWLERARNANPELPYLRCHLASAYAWTSEIDRAAAELSEARTLRGEGYSNISQMKAVGYFGVPTVNDLYEATFFAGLRKAGVPEE
jgi:TolB-like protein/class 3 adenylate cyclase